MELLKNITEEKTCMKTVYHCIDQGFFSQSIELRVGQFEVQVEIIELRVEHFD